MFRHAAETENTERQAVGPQTKMENGHRSTFHFYRIGFWALATFLLGNATAFVTFGLNTVSKSDFEKYESSVEQHMNEQDLHAQQMEKTISNLVGQLQAKKEIQPN